MSFEHAFLWAGLVREASTEQGHANRQGQVDGCCFVKNHFARVFPHVVRGRTTASWGEQLIDRDKGLFKCRMILSGGVSYPKHLALE